MNSGGTIVYMAMNIIASYRTNRWIHKELGITAFADVMGDHKRAMSPGRFLTALHRFCSLPARCDGADESGV